MPELSGPGQESPGSSFYRGRKRNIPPYAAILDAVRAHRTVVCGLNQVYGDPALIQLAEIDGRLRDSAPSPTSRGGPLDWFSRVAGVLGLAGVVLIGTRSRSEQ